MENKYAGVFTCQVEEDARTAFSPPDWTGKPAPLPKSRKRQWQRMGNTINNKQCNGQWQLMSTQYTVQRTGNSVQPEASGQSQWLAHSYLKYIEYKVYRF